METKEITTFPALVNALDKCIWTHYGYDNYDVFSRDHIVSCASLFDAISLLHGCSDKVLKDMADVNSNYKYEAQRMADMLKATIDRIPDNIDDLEDFDDERYFHYEKSDIIHNFSYLCEEWIERLVGMYGIKAPSLKEPQANAENPQQARATIENGKIVALPYKIDAETAKEAVSYFNKAIEIGWIIPHADGSLSWAYGAIGSKNDPRYLALIYFVINVCKFYETEFDTKTTIGLFSLDPNNIRNATGRARRLVDGDDPQTEWMKKMNAEIGFT